MITLGPYLENKLFDALLRGQEFIPPAYTFIGLASPPTKNDPGREVQALSYQRVRVESSLTSWSGTQSSSSIDPSDGTSGYVSNNGDITFPQPTEDWGVVGYFALYDAPTDGNLLLYGTLARILTIYKGAPPPSFSAGTFVLTFRK